MKMNPLSLTDSFAVLNHYIQEAEVQHRILTFALGNLMTDNGLKEIEVSTSDMQWFAEEMILVISMGTDEVKIELHRRDKWIEKQQSLE